MPPVNGESKRGWGVEDRLKRSKEERIEKAVAIKRERLLQSF